MEDSVSRFWDKYIAKTVDNNVPEGARRWYVRHIEIFIKYRDGKKLSVTSKHDVEIYIERIGRKKKESIGSDSIDII